MFESLEFEFRRGSAMAEADNLRVRRSAGSRLDVRVGGGVRIELLGSLNSVCLLLLIVSLVGVFEGCLEVGPGEEDNCLEGSTGGRTSNGFGER